MSDVACDREPLYFRLGHAEEANALVKQHHYSHRPPTNARCVGTWHRPGGLFGDAGEAVAACVFASPPTRWSEEVLELVRLVRCPDVQAPLSGLISMTCRAVRVKRLADLLVSFADWTQKHHGGIYQAAGWNYAGLRSRSMDGVIVNGEFVPGRTAVARFGTRSPIKLRNEKGIQAEPHYDEGKHLYWRAVRPSGRKKATRLGLGLLPYPKPGAPEVSRETRGHTNAEGLGQFQHGAPIICEGKDA